MKSPISIVAVSADIEAFKKDRLFDDSVVSKYPGASWFPILARNLRNRGLCVTTADIALDRVKQGDWRGEQIGIVQHLDDPVTEELIISGARPIVLTVFESPLYVPDFYHNARLIAAKFAHRIMFSGLFKKWDFQTGANHQVTFPIYHQGTIPSTLPWSERKFLAMIVENKYHVPFSGLYLRHPADILRLIKRSIWTIVSPELIKSQMRISRIPGYQLHDKRIEAVLYFAGKNSLHLFGKGWHNLDNLPRTYAGRLGPFIRRTNPEFVINKTGTLRNFKFTLCFENYSYPGYITEKIIDCFVAGTIPVYLGAPDIGEYIPKGCYINAGEFETYDKLWLRLNSMTTHDAERIIAMGREFLASDIGLMYSFEGFAGMVENLIVQNIGTQDTQTLNRSHVTNSI